MSELEELRLALAATEERLQATYETLAIQSAAFAELRAECEARIEKLRVVCDAKVKRAEAARDWQAELLAEARAELGA